MRQSSVTRGFTTASICPITCILRASNLRVAATSTGMMRGPTGAVCAGTPEGAGAVCAVSYSPRTLCHPRAAAYAAIRDTTSRRADTPSTARTRCAVNGSAAMIGPTPLRVSMARCVLALHVACLTRRAWPTLCFTRAKRAGPRSARGVSVVCAYSAHHPPRAPIARGGAIRPAPIAGVEGVRKSSKCSETKPPLRGRAHFALVGNLCARPDARSCAYSARSSAKIASCAVLRHSAGYSGACGISGRCATVASTCTVCTSHWRFSPLPCVICVRRATVRPSSSTVAGRTLCAPREGATSHASPHPRYSGVAIPRAFAWLTHVKRSISTDFPPLASCGGVTARVVCDFFMVSVR